MMLVDITCYTIIYKVLVVAKDDIVCSSCVNPSHGDRYIYFHDKRAEIRLISVYI